MRRTFSLISWILIVQLVSLGSGILTQKNIPTWYETLTKSPLTPPGYVFGLVWPILYLLIAIVGWRIWLRRQEDSSKKLMALYALQLFLNWAWTPVFFGMHAIRIGFVLIVALLVVTLLLIYQLLRWDRPSAWMLVPYALWLGFANYLNLYITFYN